MSNPADCNTGASVQVQKYTTWLNMNHCQYIKYKMSNPADCTIGDSVQVIKYTTWLNMNHCQYNK
jgi:hypothetical protein